MNISAKEYNKFLNQIKERIRSAQIKAALSVNAELIFLYWDIGRIIDKRQKAEGWGASVIPKLSKDLKNELPEIKGFSERNIGRMLAFYKEYPLLNKFLPQLVAKTENKKLNDSKSQTLECFSKKEILEKIYFCIPKIPWGHNILLMEKVKDISLRLWYIQKTIDNGWSRSVLNNMIDNQLHVRQGQVISNFDTHLPFPQSDLAKQTLKDPYIFDFLTLEEPFHEKELENHLIHHLEKFLLELGQGFAFVGRQYHISVGDNDFYIDLLFYHLKLRCFIVIEIKKGEFKPEYAGKINFYCNVIDDTLKHPTDNQTIGLILCQEKDKILAEYALRGFNKPIGVSEYGLTRSLPKKLKSSLPSVEELEKELKNNKNKLK